MKEENFSWSKYYYNTRSSTIKDSSSVEAQESLINSRDYPVRHLFTILFPVFAIPAKKQDNIKLSPSLDFHKTPKRLKRPVVY